MTKKNPPQNLQINDTPNRKPRPSTLIVPSGFTPKEGEEKEITAQISLPEEGGWGWVVMVTSFISICFLDGVIFSYGSLFADIRDDLSVEESLVALINSVLFALCFTAGPIASAIINRYGFRECTMIGSVICSIGLLISYFAPNYGVLLVFYGIVNGFGACLINLASNLVVGFYFEKLRSLVLAISGSGSSAGIMILNYLTTYMTARAGWRVSTLFHAGLYGIIYFLGMTYRPLVTLTVVKTTEEDPTRTITYLPNVSKQKSGGAPTTQNDALSGAERLFNAVSNSRFPTAATAVDEGVLAPGTQQEKRVQDKQQAGPSTVSTTKLKLTAHSPSGINHRQMKSLQNIASRSHLQDKSNKNVPMEVSLEIQPSKKRRWWERFCPWEENLAESRPMYRDDAFYGGKIEDLPVYRKSVIEIPKEERTGLEYQLAVTRTVEVEDLGDRTGLCTTAFKRILVSMIDVKLLRRFSFMLLCISALCTYLGFLVPYVFLIERNKFEGIAPEHCSMLISVIGFTNLVGRLILGAVACKIDPLKIYSIACVISGVATMAFNFSFTLYYQYACGSIFGFFIASLASLRSMVLVKLYGIEMLTNATGLMVVFQGIGSLISTPLATLIKANFGFDGAFYLAGIFIVISGLTLIPVQLLVNSENKAALINAEITKNTSKPPVTRDVGVPSKI